MGASKSLLLIKMGASKSVPDVECIEHNFTIGDIVLSAKKEVLFSHPGELILLHTLAIGEWSIQFKEVKSGKKTKKTLLTKITHQEFKRFRFEWEALWHPDFPDEYSSLSDIIVEFSADFGPDSEPIVQWKETIGSVITINGKKYEIQSTLGSGGSSFVYRALAEDGVPVAIKKVLLNKPQSSRKFREEVILLERLRSNSRIVDLIDYAEVSSPNGKLLYEVLELGDNDLDNFLHEKMDKREFLTDHEIKGLWLQMLQAVKVIHSLGM